jgi:dTDP-glucose 4,6-dehydratase
LACDLGGSGWLVLNLNRLPKDGTHGKCCLVTGGAGFIGSHLCDRLLAEGSEVICLDNLITGNVENIRHLLDQPGFRFVQHDVTSPIDLDSLLTKAENRGQPVRPLSSLDFVLHLASPASPKDYARFPIHTLKVGALGTWHALGVARAMGATFLLTSTSEVYGDPAVSPQPESYWGHVNPIGPRSVYDEAKRYAEAITVAYHREHGVKIRIARIFNTYGERMRVDDGRALPNFVSQALQGEPLTVYGDGRQTRSLCYVSDLVDGLYRLLVSDETGPVNLGNPDEVSMLELAHEIIALTQSKSTVVFEPLPTDDPRSATAGHLESPHLARLAAEGEPVGGNQAGYPLLRNETGGGVQTLSGQPGSLNRKPSGGNHSLQPVISAPPFKPGFDKASNRNGGQWDSAVTAVSRRLMSTNCNWFRPYSGVSRKWPATGIRRCASPVQRLPVIPRHPLRRIPRQFSGVPLQLRQVVEGIGAV